MQKLTAYGNESEVPAKLTYSATIQLCKMILLQLRVTHVICQTHLHKEPECQYCYKTGCLEQVHSCCLTQQSHTGAAVAAKVAQLMVMLGWIRQLLSEHLQLAAALPVLCAIHPVEIDTWL